MTEPTPLSAEEEADLRRTVDDIGPDADVGGGWWGNGEVARLLATLDAARATVPAADDRERLAWALATIRDLCDMDLDTRRKEFGNEHRVLFVIIPGIVADALGGERMPSTLERTLFRVLSRLRPQGAGVSPSTDLAGASDVAVDDEAP